MSIGFKTPITLNPPGSECPTESSALCRNTVGWFSKWCEKPVDTICERTKGVVQIEPVYIRWSNALGLPVLLVVGAVSAYLGLKAWNYLRAKNPQATTEQLIEKMLDEKLGSLKDPIVKKLKEILSPIMEDYKAQVKQEQPWFSGDDAESQKMVAAGTESKMKEFAPHLVTLLAAPESVATLKKTAEQIKSAPSAAAAAAASDETAAGLQESALLAQISPFMNALVEKAKASLASKNDKVYITDGKRTMNYRDAYGLPGFVMCPAVMVPVDDSNKPLPSFAPRVGKL